MAKDALRGNSSETLIGPEQAVELRRRSVKWYAANHRALPWRETNDPYAIWLSETMLQQTQVATVLDYYCRFLDRFPTIHSLAKADEQDVLLLWAGLGYYRRARQLHAAAKEIVSRFSGVFPRSVDEIQSLPGIGRYSAGAIASFAYDARAPIVEANTVRLYSRLLGMQIPARSTEGQKRLWQFADLLLPKRRGSGKVNQSLIELGSQVCFPKEPKCGACPLSRLCAAHQNGLEKQIPVLPKKAESTPLTHIVLVLRKRGKVLVTQKKAGQWWEGLWDFPLVEVDARDGRFTGKVSSWSKREIQHLETLVAERLGIECRLGQNLFSVRHSVTRYRILRLGFDAQLLSIDRETAPPVEWIVAGENLLPLTSPAKKSFRALKRDS